jgi:TPR repeat protein
VGQHNLGDFYEQGRGGLAKSDVEATWWYLRAADQGPARRAARGLDRMTRQPFDGIAAQQSSGMQRDCATWAPSEHGYGGERQDDEAAADYRRSAEGGDAFGQYTVGVFYEDGRGHGSGDVPGLHGRGGSGSCLDPSNCNRSSR